MAALLLALFLFVSPVHAQETSKFEDAVIEQLEGLDAEDRIARLEDLLERRKSHAETAQKLQQALDVARAQRDAGVVDSAELRAAMAGDAKQAAAIVARIEEAAKGPAPVKVAKRAESPADCMMFAGYGLGATKMKPDRDVQVLTAKRAPTAIQDWMNLQIAAGRERFVATPVFTNGGVLCAW